MARYELRIRPSVAKDLRDIPPADVRRILARIEACKTILAPLARKNFPHKSATVCGRETTASCTPWRTRKSWSKSSR